MEDQTFEDVGFEDLDDSLEDSDDLFEDEDEIEPSIADTSGEDGSDQESLFLRKAKEITGREFKDEEDFKKHYKHLSAYVGKKVSQTKQPKQVSKAPESDKITELEFKVENPHLKDHFDLIKMVARERGKSYSEVVDDPLVKELLEVRESKKGESIIHSKQKISPDNSNIQKLKKSVHTEDGLAGYLEALGHK